MVQNLRVDLEQAARLEAQLKGEIQHYQSKLSTNETMVKDIKKALCDEEIKNRQLQMQISEMHGSETQVQTQYQA